MTVSQQGRKLGDHHKGGLEENRHVVGVMLETHVSIRLLANSLSKKNKDCVILSLGYRRLCGNIRNKVGW